MAWLLGAAGVVCALAHADGLMLYSLDEVKNATCAREMWRQNNWIIPTFNDGLRTDKPPLHYYFMIFAYSLFGPTAWAARLFSGVMGGASVMLTYLFGKRYLGHTSALWGALILLASVHWAVQFHMSVPDPYLIFFMLAALMAFYHGLQTRRSVYLLLMYAALALGTLAKGPIALALPGLIMLLYLLFSRQLRWPVLRQLHLPLGVLLYAAVVLPWYVLVHIHTDGAWTEGFFLKHNVGRFTDTMEGHGGIFLVTLAFVLGGMLPFSVYIPQALYDAYQHLRNPSTGQALGRSERRDVLLFLLVGAATIVIFFAISRTKLPNYTVPAYPLLALLIGAFFRDRLKQDQQARLRPALWVYAGLALLMPIAGYIGLSQDETVRDLNAWAFWLALWPATAAGALWYSYRKKTQPGLKLLAAGHVVFVLLFFYIVYPPIDQRNPVAQSMHFIRQQDTAVVAYKQFNPAYVFHYGAPIRAYEKLESMQARALKEPIYIITRRKYIQALVAALPAAQVVFRQRDTFERSKTAIIQAGPAFSAQEALPGGFSPE